MKVSRRRSRAISTVIGTLIFLLAALAILASLGLMIARGLSFNQAAISTAETVNDKGKESLLVSSVADQIVPANPTAPTCGGTTDPVLVRNVGAVTSVVTYTFGVDSSGTLWTCTPTSSATQVSIPPGANATLYLPSQPSGGFNTTGVITSLGNTFYGYGGLSTNDALPGNAIVIGGSLAFAPSGLRYFDGNYTPTGDGSAVGGFAPWPATGGGSDYVGGIGVTCYYEEFFGCTYGISSILFKVTVTNLDPVRSITLSASSALSTSGSQHGEWFIVDSLQPDPSGTAGVVYNPYNPYAPPTIPPGATRSLYFAAPTINGTGAPDSPPLGQASASPMTLTLVGTYSDGTLFTGSATFGPAYYTCVGNEPTYAQGCPYYYDFYNHNNYDYQNNLVFADCNDGEACPLAGHPGATVGLNLTGCGGCTFDSAPQAYWLNPSGTVSDVTASTSLNEVTLEIPTSASVGTTYQVFITDGINFVDVTVYVS